MTNYRRGAARERQWAERLADEGWSVTRSAGSHGAADIVGCKNGVIVYDQVKTDRAGPYAHFGPAERRELLGEATKAGAQARLVYWPPNGTGPRVIPPESWPST